jgi:hypothetical protein
MKILNVNGKEMEFYLENDGSFVNLRVKEVGDRSAYYLLSISKEGELILYGGIDSDFGLIVDEEGKLKEDGDDGRE